MNGKLVFPSHHTFMLMVLRANNAPPKRTPLLNVEGFLEKIKPISPPVKTRPPVKRINELLQSIE